MKAYLKNNRQSPRKVRLVANLIRGKNVEKVLAGLSFMDKKSAPVIKKLVESAVSNAKNQGKSVDNLFIKEILVDQGISFRRFMPRAFGRATPFRKRTSCITLTLGEGNGNNK